MKTKDLSKPQAEFNLVWDCVFIVLCIFAMLALFLVLPTDAKAGENAKSGAWRASWAFADSGRSASAAEAVYAPNFKRPLTAGSVGTTLSQPVQPNRAGISGAATQIRIGF